MLGAQRLKCVDSTAWNRSYSIVLSRVSWHSIFHKHTFPKRLTGQTLATKPLFRSWPYSRKLRTISAKYLFCGFRCNQTQLIFYCPFMFYPNSLVFGSSNDWFELYCIWRGGVETIRKRMKWWKMVVRVWGPKFGGWGFMGCHSFSLQFFFYNNKQTQSQERAP